MRSRICQLIAVLIILGQGAALAQTQPQPYARDKRFAFSLSFGFGSASLGDFHEFVDEFSQDVQISEPPKSGLQINAEVALRYYFPYYILAQVGYATLYNKTSADLDVATPLGNLKVTISNDNLVMETPILLGGYYTFIDRLYVLGAVGPSVFFFPRSFWDMDVAGIPDFKADPGVGFHALGGADFLVTENLALGLEVRYRYLKTDYLKDVKRGTPLGIKRPDGSIKVYDMPGLDFSGVSLAVVLRFYVI